MNQLIEEHFKNPALRFEELKQGMWIWDRRYSEWLGVRNIFINKNKRRWIESFCVGEKETVARLYEPNRFYRKEVHND